MALGAAKVAVRITVEAANEPGQLNEIFEFKKAAQIDYEPEQLNEIVEFEEAAQIDSGLE